MLNTANFSIAIVPNFMGKCGIPQECGTPTIFNKYAIPNTNYTSHRSGQSGHGLTNIFD